MKFQGILKINYRSGNKKIKLILDLKVVSKLLILLINYKKVIKQEREMEVSMFQNFSDVTIIFKYSQTTCSNCLDFN